MVYELDLQVGKLIGKLEDPERDRLAEFEGDGNAVVTDLLLPFSMTLKAT